MKNLCYIEIVSDFLKHSVCCRSDDFTTNMATTNNIRIVGVLLRLTKGRTSTCHVCRREGLYLAAACRLLDSHRSKDVVVTIGAAVLLSDSCSISATYMLHRSVLRAAVLLWGVVNR